MAELWFDAEASAALDRLERDPARRPLLAAVDRVLDQLETDTSAESGRRRLFTTTDPPLWCVQVFVADEEWGVLWNPHPHMADAVVVHYLGPASFA